MNSLKSLVNRNALQSKHARITEQPALTAALLSLVGVNTIILNHWAVKPEENLNLYKSLLSQACTENIYLGASLRKYREPEKVETKDGDEVKEELVEKMKLYTHNTVVYGVPIVRIV
jgi:hypothetical protein